MEHVFALIALFAACALGLVSLVFGLPGTIVILASAAVYAWSSDFARVGWPTLGWMATLALAAEGVEVWATTLAAGASGRPSRRVAIGAVLGSVAGGIVGAPFFFGIGALVGALLGAFGGAALAVASYGGPASEMWTTGWAALRGRWLGFVLKSAFAMGMILALTIALFQ